jgi:O-antigen/teichoic acid export membrane protein
MEPAKERSSGYAAALSLVGTGFIVRLAADMVGVLAAAATIAIAVRLLGPTEYGTLALLLAVVDLVTALGRLGLGLGTAQTVAAAHDDEARLLSACRGSMTLALVTGGVSGLVVVGFVLFGPVHADAGTRLVVGLGLALLLAGNNYSLSVYSIARGMGRIGWMETVALVIPVAQLLVLVALAAADLPNLRLVAAGFGLAGLLGAAVSARVLRELVPGMHGLYRPSPRAARTMLLIALPFAMAGVATQLMGQFDVVVLGIFHSGADVTAYQPTLKLTDGLLKLIPYLLAGAYIPAATRLFHREDRVGFRELYVTTTKLGYIVSFPAVIALCAFPEVLLRALYGPDFPVQVNLVWILLVGYVVNLVMGTNTFALVSAGDRRGIMTMNVAGVATMVVVALVLIPPLGPVGGALATTCSYVIWNAAASWVLLRSTGVHPLRRDLVVVVGTSAVALAAAVIVRWALRPDALWTVAVWSVLLWAAWVALLVRVRALGRSELAPLAVWRQRHARKAFLTGDRPPAEKGVR